MNIERSRLLESVRQAAREKDLSARTENAYKNHIRRFLAFNGNSDLSVQRAEKIRAFLLHLRKDVNLSASTRNQARCALMFFYRHVLEQELSAHFHDIERVPLSGKHFVVFTPQEAKAVLSKMRGMQFLIASLIYGSGLRLSEAIALRVRDIDFERNKIIVPNRRSGMRERATVLPKAITGKLRLHLEKVKFTHEDDCLSGGGRVFLPEKIFRRSPEEAHKWEWQYVFPAVKLTRGGDVLFRHHIAESTMQKAVSEAIVKAKIQKPGCCLSLRYSFAVRLFEQNCSAHTIQNLLGHKNLKTTMSYLNGNDETEAIVYSPLDS